MRAGQIGLIPSPRSISSSQLASSVAVGGSDYVISTSRLAPARSSHTSLRICDGHSRLSTDCAGLAKNDPQATDRPNPPRDCTPPVG